MASSSRIALISRCADSSFAQATMVGDPPLDGAERYLMEIDILPTDAA
ncbi:hypothetical protein ABMA10_07490 [Plantibacter sp. RU18]